MDLYIYGFTDKLVRPNIDYGYIYNGAFLNQSVGIPDIDAFFVDFDIIAIVWNSVPGATSYELQRDVNGGGWTTIQDNSNIDYYDIDYNPYAISLIQYKVRAKVGSFIGEFSAPVGVATPMA